MLTAQRRAMAAAVILSGSLLLSSCGGSDDGGSSDGKTLKLWHYEGPDSAMGVAWNEAIKEFEAQHPGVKVKFEEKGFEQIQKTAPMVLNSSDAPDIMEYNKGNATAGLLSKQGLLTDLTAEATKRGWDKKIPASVGTTDVYDTNGVMGSGKWYGVTDYGEYTMVYYNKALFKKYKIAEPKTFDELTAAMAQFTAKGITPSRTPAPSTRPSSTSTNSPSRRPTAPGSTSTSCTRARRTSTTRPGRTRRPPSRTG